MADINTTITVLLGLLSIIIVFVGILISISANKISEAQKRIAMVSIMQPLTKNPKVYELFLDYIMSEWFDGEDMAMFKGAMEIVGIKEIIVGSGKKIHAETKSEEEKVLQQMLKVLNEINKKLERS